MNIIDWILYIPWYFAYATYYYTLLPPSFTGLPNTPKPVRSDASLCSFPPTRKTA